MGLDSVKNGVQSLGSSLPPSSIGVSPLGGESVILFTVKGKEFFQISGEWNAHIKMLGSLKNTIVVLKRVGHLCSLN